MAQNEINGGDIEIQLDFKKIKGNKKTIVRGIPKDKLLPILGMFKNDLGCNGNVCDDPKSDSVLQLTGDQRKTIDNRYNSYFKRIDKN
ncbi:hypothetical protein A0H76_166 [Hepatospora eriocheir]|uniref:SUI1 domain-containing protein n=1 Tax=Hepatospora eriocheir TaxID=1081669 RepID=A0A1X0QJB0_9MICR|nr:hypothetical protein A0H76_166 [Hepatospora eriocheir]